jgi:hypothetical protein
MPQAFSLLGTRRQPLPFNSDIGLDQTRGVHAASVEMELKT